MSRPDHVQPRITALYGIPMPEKRRALIISQGQSATVTFQFLDYIGNPVSLWPYDFHDCGPQGPQGPQDSCAHVIGRVREVISTKVTDIMTVPCTVVDASKGIIQFFPPHKAANNPGVYTAEFAVYKPKGLTQLRAMRAAMTNRFCCKLPSIPIAFTNKCYIWVDRGLFGDPKYPNAGPPSLDEVRLFMRDNAPEENLLLDDYEFDLAEICHSAELGVRYWNEAQPPINIFFNTCNYAVRHKWLQAIAGHMFLTAAHRFRRNHLPYQAGGIAVDDQNKYQQYDQIGMSLSQEYREWVKWKKVQVNCEMAITSTGSSYGSLAYQLLNTGV